MNTGFKISLLHLLLLIPQYGNSPLPAVESWLQKDQDDGSVERDMTSSLTGGDESFGSAHKTYQNSLIRKKKSDDLGNVMPAVDYRTLALNYNRNPQYDQRFFDGQYFNRAYNPSVENERMNPVFEGYNSNALPYSKLLPRTSNLRNPVGDNSNSGFLNIPNRDRGYMNNVKLHTRQSEIRLDDERNLNKFSDDLGGSAKWSMCKKLKTRYAPNTFTGLRQSLPVDNQDMYNFNFQNEYMPIQEGRRGREIRIRENRLGYRPEAKNQQVLEEDEYYDVDANPEAGEDDLNLEDTDYNQMLKAHAYLHKRDEKKQLENAQKSESAETSKASNGALCPADLSKNYMSDQLSENGQEDTGGVQKANPKTRDTNSMNQMPDSDLVWKLTSDLQSKELNDVMRKSQRALQEVQQFQQKLAYKQPPDANDNEVYKRQGREDPLIKYEKKMSSFDDKRLKREDEDEQKNMKTGTDEGGGGEYEDEEGKGHKDEEEYYEDADLSNDDSGPEVQTTDDLNQKYVKREVSKDAHSKNEKTDHSDIESQDYELNLKNAPVENAEKSKKSSFREGEKTNKHCVRKGVKIWDQWGKWSPCSVTCGIGRSTRWRHCIGGGCAQGEKEAQIKKCTNPACR